MQRSFHPAKPLLRSHMPVNFDISLDQYTNNRNVRLPVNFGPEQSLPGFDATYANIIDYIVRITYRIWESGDWSDAPRQVGYISDCYSPDCRVYDDYGLQFGSDKIISDTHHTTSAFPDIELRADEIIWAGNGDVGFHTSHLTRIVGTNTGDSKYGPATGKPIDVMVIANCVARENDIFLEHVLYNTSTMLLNLGVDPMNAARALVNNAPAGWPRTAEVWESLRTEGAPSSPLFEVDPVGGFDPDEFVRRVHTASWQQGNTGALDQWYHSDLQFEGSSNHRHTGLEAYKNIVQASHCVFHNRKFQVDEVYWMGNTTDGYLVSTRWSMDAVHVGGNSPFGPATQAPLQIWGITQQQIVDGKIAREWLLFNELDVMMQVCAAHKPDR